VPRSDWVRYVIQRGDTLFIIARASGIRTDVLRQGNCLTSNVIITGTTILIPPDSPLVNNPSGTGTYQREGCSDPTVQITSPALGETVGSVITVFGTADYPDFGYYILELKHANGDGDYLPILTSPQRVAPNRELGLIVMQPSYPADTYWIRIRVFNSQNQLAQSCAIQVRYAP
jgi:hypothetical protein